MVNIQHPETWMLIALSIIIGAITYRIRGGWRPFGIIPSGTTWGRLVFVLTFCSLALFVTLEWWRLLGFALTVFGTIVLGHGAMLDNGRNTTNKPRHATDGEIPSMWLLGKMQYRWSFMKRWWWCIGCWAITGVMRATPVLWFMGVFGVTPLAVGLYLLSGLFIGLLYEIGWQTYYRATGKDATFINEFIVGAYKLGIFTLLFIR